MIGSLNILNCFLQKNNPQQDGKNIINDSKNKLHWNFFMINLDIKNMESNNHSDKIIWLVAHK